MHKSLSGDGSRRTIILHGLGGIGKTQLAIAHAKRHKDSYSAIFWLKIKDADSLKQSFARVAMQILRGNNWSNCVSEMKTVALILAQSISRLEHIEFLNELEAIQKQLHNSRICDVRSWIHW